MTAALTALPQLEVKYDKAETVLPGDLPLSEEEITYKKARVPYELYIYKDANHGFNKGTVPARYQEAAARLAWERTLRLFGEILK